MERLKSRILTISWANEIILWSIPPPPALKQHPPRPASKLYAQGDFAEILAAVQACLPKDGEGNFVAEKEKSDVVHDLLAFLAKRMLEMNKEKQQEIRGFLAVLKKNRKKLAVDPARRGPGVDIRAEFEGSMGRLGPLLVRIRQTDGLIDAVVYRLYALTEEEIGIVEGKAK